MAVTAVVPYRAGQSTDRQANAEAVLRWLSGCGADIVLVEHADAPDIDLTVPPNTERIHLPAQALPFNKAQACNEGFLRARHETIAIVDADTMISVSAFRACADRIGKTHDVIRPFGRLIELDAEVTERVRLGGELPVPTSRGRDDNRDGEHIPLCGGIVMMLKTAYIHAGGMDTSFKGWGGEDDAFSVAIRHTSNRIAIASQEVAFHLAHERPIAQRYGHDHYQENNQRARWWHSATTAELDSAIMDMRAALVKRM